MRKALVLTLLSVLVLSASASADVTGPNKRKPPNLRLVYKGEVVQRAQPYTFCWSTQDPDGGGVGMCADGFPRYPKAVKVDAPTRLTIRIPYPAKPSEWYLRAHRAIVRHDYWDEPVGPAEEIPFKLKPRRVDGKIRAWRVVFRVEEPARHYYLDTGGILKQGDAFYTLHVKS